MSEGELIEVAQRFRALEDEIEMLKKFVNECRRQKWWPERRKRDDEDWDQTMDDADRAAEVCRDDMNRMADEIRKAKR